MNRFRKLALAAGLVFAYPHAADAADYYRVASTSGGNSYSLDAASERHVRGFVQMNLFQREHMGDLVISVMKTMEFDCSGRRSRMIRSIQYGMDGEKIGESVDFHGFSNDVPDSEKLVIERVLGDHALPPSLEGMVLDFVCGSAEHRERYPYVGNLP